MLSPLSWTLPTRAATVADCLASVVLAVGYAVLVVRAVAATRRASLLAWAAPVGRTAFTNYVVQTVVLGLLFHGHGHGHGHGLGLMGRIGVAAGLGVAAAIYAAQVFASRL